MLKDVNGRVPFAVIGVIIMIGSAITTNFVIISQHRISNAIIYDSSPNIKHLIESAEADMKRELAYAGLYAFDIVGRSPVAYSNVYDYPNAIDYIEDAERNSNKRNGKIDTMEEMIEFNKNWIRNLMRYKFNEYINATFRDNRYSYDGYAINVVVNKRGNAIGGWKEINLIPVKAKIERTVDFGWLIGDKNKKYTEYWEAEVKNIKIKIVNIKSGRNIIKNIEIKTLIPSRLPLLMELTNFYNNSINDYRKGIISLSPLNGFLTAVGMGYTEARALMKYAGGKPSNIVDNLWLQYITNMAILLVEYLVYNSVDPVSMAYLAIDAKDLINDDSISSKALSNLNELKTSVDFGFGDVSSTLGIDMDYDDMSRRVYKKLNDNNEGRETVLKIAKGILYPANFEYNNSNIKENYDYSNINKDVLNKILEKVTEVYSAHFSTKVKETIIDEWYSQDVSGQKWRIKSFGDWHGETNITSGENLIKGKRPNKLPYTEIWSGEWNREEIWEHLEKTGDDEGNPIYKWMPYHITHHIKGTYEFTLIASPIYSDILDVFKSKPYDSYNDDNMEYMLSRYIDNFFINIREYELKSPPENKEFSKYSCLWSNNSVKDCCDNKNCSIDSNGYGIDWLIGKNGEVVKELKGVINEIEQDVNDGIYDKEINKNYSSKYKNDLNGMVLLEDIENYREMILKKFRENRNKYLDEGKYKKEGEFFCASCKVIYDIKYWFLNKIESELSKDDGIKEKINNEIKNSGLDYESIKTNMEKYREHISSITTIQFGNKIVLNGKWKENISIAISTKPAYFDYRVLERDGNPVKHKEKWKFSVKNTCLFGPSGLPLLPTPVTPWIVTLNTWYIEINGTWEYFKVVDATDETIPDEVFGHIGQIYQLKYKEVEDISKNLSKIGICKPISFTIKTITLAIVPPGKLGIGDDFPIVEKNP